ncbi:MAG: N-acetylneuraminate synthase family protein [Candidatus Riflebacteria bacterium]|nr:N-acetylneuraminate synthase family protein [Candidatus Riflebacteria bacterium]
MKFCPPFLIAEIGVNHECKMDLAIRQIEEASEAGANAVKFQTYRAETLASVNSPAYWDTSKEPTNTQYQLFKKHDKFWKKDFEKLKEHCDKVGVEFLSTPFDQESAVFLNDLMEVFKISSSDITNKPFIQFISAFDKPILLSTGASTLSEIESSIEWFEKANPFALMHCVLCYPTPDEEANLAMIKGLKAKFPGICIGYSDHTLPGDMKNLEVAFLLGATILEKHFTHDKTLPGNDHYHSMDKTDLKLLKNNLQKVISILGSEKKQPLDAEKSARENARRSLVASQFIPAGKQIEIGDITWKRPAHGISPADIDLVLTMKANRKIQKDEILFWNFLD